MSAGRAQGSPWLSLGEAARLLGITPATLRRWADAGEVAVFVTPGGHRRFPRAVVEALIPVARSQRPTLAELGLSGDRITLAYRRRSGGAAVAWLDRLSEEQRERQRGRGRELVQVLVAYLDSRGAGGEALMERAERESEEYGRLAAQVGATLTETVQGFLYFRAPFLGELARQSNRKRLPTSEATSLLMEAEFALDRLLVAVMDGYRPTPARRIR